MDIEKALKEKIGKRDRFLKEADILNKEIEVLKAAYTIMGAKERKRKKHIIEKSVTEDIKNKFTLRENILKALSDSKAKITASEIADMLIKKGWKPESSAPSTVIRSTLVRMLKKKEVRRRKKGNKVIYWMA